MDKLKRFAKSKLCFALSLSLVFALVQLPLVWRHELSLPESQFYHRYFVPLGISYTVARYVPLAFTTLTVFLLSWLLPFRRITKVCIAFSSLFFYFNSVLLAGFRVIPLGRELIFSNPVDFFSSVNESVYHTFLPIAQLCLALVAVYILDRIFHFKFLRKLELIKIAKLHHISGGIVFLLPVALSIPNAIISGVEDYNHQYSGQSALTSVTQELNKLPEGAAIILSDKNMRPFALTYAPLLENGQYFYDMITGSDFSYNILLDEANSLETDEIQLVFPEAEHIYYLANTSTCSLIQDTEPYSNWEHLGLIRQLDERRAFDFYKIK